MTGNASTPRLNPVVTPALRRLLILVLVLFALLAADSAYLASVSLVEWARGERLQDTRYLLAFLAHLALGLSILVPFLVFGALHLLRARARPNRRAVRAGLALLGTGLVVLVTGLLLTRFGFLEVNDPRVREPAYWIHVASPLVLAWLFVRHRRAGPPIRWRAGGLTAGVAALACAAALGAQTLLARPDPAARGGADFAPSLAKLAGATRIPARELMRDAYCEQCHADAARGWRHSVHRLSSFNNPAYRFSVGETRRVSLARHGDMRMARFCAGCHDPVPLFSGEFDDPDFDPDGASAQAGLTCTACHAIESVDSVRGNADYTVSAPAHYPFAFSESPFLRAVSRQLIRARPALHKRTFLKPFHREAEFCAACHKTHIPQAVNGYRWLRGQNHYDSWLLSGVSGHGIESFYYPARAVPACARCHMPLEASGDPAARDFDGSGQRSVHGHDFAAANTGVPHLAGLAPGANDARRAFLEGAARIDLFGLRAEGRVTGELLAPLRPQVPALRPGATYLLEAVVRTLRVGHLLTQGTADSNELWLELTVRDGDRVVARSGALGADGGVDPWAHFLNAYLLDRDGNRIDRRNAQDVVTALYDHQIPPGAAAVVHYRLQVPHDARGPLTVTARVRYRKFDTSYLRHVQGAAFAGNDLPVATLAEDAVSFPLAVAAADVPPPQVPAWERWNDYGIGMLRQGALRQAEAAFARVEDLGRPDGPLNLARVYLEEGRLDAAGAALRRAATFDPPAPPWSVAWFTGRVNRQNGFLDEAAQSFRAVAETRFAEARARGFDFSRDYRVLNALGETLYERARLERGAARRAARAVLLDEARDWFGRALDLDPENVTAHYNLALVLEELGEADAAARHRALHLRFKPDENARQRVIAAHRTRNPPANHAAERIVVYDLQAPGAHLAALAPEARAAHGAAK